MTNKRIKINLKMSVGSGKNTECISDTSTHTQTFTNSLADIIKITICNEI